MGLFDKLESKLEQGVNGAFARAFKSEVQPVEIASGIRRAMDDRAASVGKGKRPIVPNLFTIELSPTDYDRLSEWGDELDDELIASAQEHADEQRYMPGGPLTIVLTESDDLETGVFRLRPATAKAADALAHQRNNPRPQRETHHDDTSHDAAAQPTGAIHDAHLDTRDASDAYDAHSGTHAGVAGASAASALGSTTSPHPTGRTFGTRIKDYLLGSPQPTTDSSLGHAAPGAPSAASEYGRNDERGYLDREAHVSAPPVQDSYAADDHLVEDEAGYDDYDHHGFDDAHADDRVYSGDVYADAENHDNHDANAHHAWDDDSDVGDPTGYEPAPRPESARPRQMSPRERPWLKIDGQRYPLLGAITVLGRDDDADIVVDDPGVSRRHSEIRITHDGPHLVMSVRDLGSTNGTYVNGEHVGSTHVHDGDRLTLGRTPMTIHLGDRP